MTRKILFPLLAGALCCSLISCEPAMDPENAALIADTPITMDDYRTQLERNYRGQRQAAAQTDAAKAEYLEKMVLDQLVIHQAKDEGWYDRPEFAEMQKGYENEYIERRIYELNVADKVINDSLLADTWNKQGTEVKAAHILFRWVPRGTQADSNKVRRNARAVRQEIQDGTLFASAAAEYTEERGGKSKAGELGWFTWGAMTPNFQKTCWELPVGEVSDPVETEFGVHLIHLQDRRSVEVRPDFESSKEDLRRSTMNAMRDQLVAYGRAYLDSLQKEYLVEQQPENLKVLLKQMKKHLQPEMSFPALLDSVSTDWPDLALIRWVDGDIGLEEMKQYLGRKYHAIGEGTTLEELESITLDIMLPFILEKKGRSLNLHLEENTQKQVAERMDRSILSAYKKQVFKGGASVSDEEIEAYYNTHKNDYMEKPHVKVQEIMLRDKDLAQMLMNRANNGEDFGKLAHDYTTRPGKKPDNGILDNFAEGRYGEMGKAAFEMEVEEIRGPLQLGERWSVIKLLEKIAAKPKRLDQAATSIRYKLEREKEEQTIQKWRTKVEQHYPVSLNPNAVSLLYPEQN